MSRSLYRRTSDVATFLAELGDRSGAVAPWPVRRAIMRRPSRVLTHFTAIVRAAPEFASPGQPVSALQIAGLEVADEEAALLDGQAAAAELRIRLAGHEVEEGEWTVSDLQVLEPLV